MRVVVNLDNGITIICNPRLEPTYLNIPHKFKLVIQSRLLNQELIACKEGVVSFYPQKEG
ncbi:MAG: hypothetical protein U9N57_02855 [Pseudomonadota bacterium]|nr:hypothetical protein [Pseudomonadota bacterium]